jgi:hypothetical protein
MTPAQPPGEALAQFLAAIAAGKGAPPRALLVGRRWRNRAEGNIIKLAPEPGDEPPVGNGVSSTGRLLRPFPAAERGHVDPKLGGDLGQ